MLAPLGIAVIIVALSAFECEQFSLPDRSLPEAGSVSYVADNKDDERTINGEAKAHSTPTDKSQRLHDGGPLATPQFSARVLTQAA